jgi:hypothetical protein
MSDNALLYLAHVINQSALKSFMQRDEFCTHLVKIMYCSVLQQKKISVDLTLYNASRIYSKPEKSNSRSNYNIV